ncbi:Transcription factor, fungi, partial [Metarhizium majus ARSEF 297]
MTPSSTTPKRTRACTFCRAKKIRCGGGNPCRNCADYGEECIFRPRKRRQKKRDMTADQGEQGAPEKSVPDGGQYVFEAEPHHPTSQRNPGANVRVQSFSPQGISPYEDSVIHVGALPFRSSSHATFDPNHQHIHGPHSRTLESSAYGEYPGKEYTTVASASQPSIMMVGHGWHVAPPTPQPSSMTTTSHSSSAPLLHASRGADEEGSSVYSMPSNGLEYHGPRSSMSMCSKPAIKWVRERVKTPDMQVTSQKFAEGIAQRLKIDKPLSFERQPEPSELDAWRYAKAYFDESHDAALGIVHRPWFEMKLRSHFISSSSKDDPAWYALRNIVYASGCRIVTSKAATFHETQQASWPFFENSLSVHTQLLYWQTTVTGVQALTAMAYFTDAISSPILQYMLCSMAVRLAVAKGMHRRPHSWSFPSIEESLRGFTFWALYCLDKQIASRSGRPSSIEDYEISSHVPTCCPLGGSVHLGYFTAMVKLSQLLSLVNKKLSQVRSTGSAAEGLVKVIQDLDHSLEELQQSLGDVLGVKLPLDLSNIPANLNNHQALSIQSLYYNVVWDIHTPLTYPWLRGAFALDQDAPTRTQIQASSSTVATSSRAAVLGTRHIYLDPNCCQLIVTYVPHHALVNIFVHILTDPTQASVKSELALLDIGVGYAARVDLDTESYLSLPFIGEMAIMARNAVDNAERNAVDRDTPLSNANSAVKELSTPFSGRASNMAVNERQGDEELSSSLPAEQLQMNDGLHRDDINMGFDSGDLELWSIMLPGIGDDI